MHEPKGMAYTLHRHVYEPRFLTNLSYENIYAVKIFMRLNEFSSVRLISIVRTCLKGLYAMPTRKYSEYTIYNYRKSDKHICKSGFAASLPMPKSTIHHPKCTMLL